MKEENKKEKENRIINIIRLLFQIYNNSIYKDNLYIYIIYKAVLFYKQKKLKKKN